MDEPAGDLEQLADEGGAVVAGAAPAAEDPPAGSQIAERQQTMGGDRAQAATPSGRKDAAAIAELQHEQPQRGQDDRRFLRQVGERGQHGGDHLPPSQQRDQRAQHRRRRQQIGKGREPQRGLSRLGGKKEEGAGGPGDATRTAQREDQQRHLGGDGQMQRETDQREWPDRAAADPRHQPPQGHGQRAIELAAVQVAHERQQRIGRVARERQQEVIIGEEGRRPEERHDRDRRGDPACDGARRDPPHARALSRQPSGARAAPGPRGC